MRTTLRQRLDAWQHSAHRGTAPHVDPAWAEALLLELRVQGVDGARIGEVLAEVDSHCVESGQGAREAFGAPEAYAASLALPTAPTTDARGLAAVAAAALAQTVGMLVVLWAYGAWLAGESLGVTVGQLVLVVTLTATLATLVRRVDDVLRATVRHPVRMWLAVMAHLGLTVVLLLLLDAVALRVDAAWTLAAGAALLLVGTVVQLRAAGATDEDPVVAPLGSPPRTGTRGRGAARVWTRLPALLVPAATVVLVLTTWWAAR